MKPRLVGRRGKAFIDETEALMEMHEQIFIEHLLRAAALLSTEDIAIKKMDKISVCMGLAIQESECK